MVRGGDEQPGREDGRRRAGLTRLREEEPAAPGTLQIVVAEPGEQNGPDAWSGSEEQLFVQELHRLHAED